MSHNTSNSRASLAYPVYRGMGDGPVALLFAIPRARSESTGDHTKILLTTNNGRLGTPDAETNKHATAAIPRWWQPYLTVLRRLAQQDKA
ncbi:hypothetical protein [Dyella koreensis]|uniref:Uncharacterized protein n=1 Tax=Dyella koreensis TaxID=311235 RepID=A0ABW8KBD4_9GAMM